MRGVKRERGKKMNKRKVREGRNERGEKRKRKKDE